MKPEETEGTVVLAVIEHNGRYLLVKRSENVSSSGKWVFPSGKVEENESLKEAVVREVREETSLEPETVREGEKFFNEGELGLWEIHPFLMRADSSKVVLNQENSDYNWIKLYEIENYDTLGDVKAPEKLNLN